MSHSKCVRHWRIKNEETEQKPNKTTVTTISTNTGTEKKEYCAKGKTLLFSVAIVIAGAVSTTSVYVWLKPQADKGTAERSKNVEGKHKVHAVATTIRSR